jgi:hypothetical protein
MVVCPVVSWHPGVSGARANDLMPEITPSVTAPLAEPIVRADAQLKATRATAFRMGEAQALLLEGDVTAAVGNYGFRGDRAVVRIDRERQPGREVRHVSIYFDNARPLKGVGRTEAEAQRLLVTASTLGEVKLDTDLLVRADAAPMNGLVSEASDRFGRHFAALAARTLAAPREPIFGPEAEATRVARREMIAEDQQELLAKLVEVQAPPEETGHEPMPGVPAGIAPPPRPPVVLTPPPPPAPLVEPPEADRGDTVLPRDGIVTFTAQRVVYEPAGDKGEALLMLIGDVNVIFQGLAPNRQMSLRAQNVVVFLDGEKTGDTQSRSLDADAVTGVYLEDNVIVSDGVYTLRGPRVYYDAVEDRAIVLDAVLYTWDAKRKVPLYLRAQQLRQEGVNSFVADRAKFTTSEFAEPHFHIGASQITMREVQKADGSVEQGFVARGVTTRAQNVPFFYWPRVSGETGETAIERVRLGYSSDDGPTIETEWDLFALMGRQRPDNVDLIGKLDWLGDHGVGTGVELEYRQRRMFGNLDVYLVPFDNGTDEIGGRRDIDRDNDFRGYGRWQHRQIIRDKWELSLEAAYISDETFLEEFFPKLATEEKPFETSVYLKRQENDWAFDLLASYDLNDFVAQTNRLQVYPYTVEKLPELGYYQVGTSLLDNRLTYFTENRLSRMRLNRDESTPGDRGFRDAASLSLFGIPASTTFRDDLAAAGIGGQYVNRFDTRHELQAPFKMGIVDVVPYASGRITAYDDDFNEFAGNDDNVRFMGTLGTRLHTQFHNTYGYESDLLDVRRIRHVVEPRVDLYLTGSSLDPERIPVYDVDVERLSEGAGVRIGMTNTLQTQRGGEGRWRSVDWVVLNTDFVLRSDDADVDAAIPRFYGYRPEYSTGGDHFYTDLLWAISDSLAFVGDLTYAFEGQHRVAQWRAGFTLDHSPNLTTFINYGEIDVINSQLLTYGFTYRLSTKYTMGFAHTLDLGPQNDSRNINVWLERRLPRWRLRINASVDEVDRESTLGIVLLPEGIAEATTPAFGTR